MLKAQQKYSHPEYMVQCLYNILTVAQKFSPFVSIGWYGMAGMVWLVYIIMEGRVKFQEYYGHHS